MSAYVHRKSFTWLCLVIASLIFGSSRTFAADIFVTSSLDAGAGTLREAMATAVAGDQIVFDIPAASTITLASDLPSVAGDISFANVNAAVQIDRAGFAALDLSGSQVDPTVLSINTGGVASADADIVAGAGSTVFGDGTVTGNIEIPSTLAPGSSSAAGTTGTFDVVGDLNLSGGTGQFDISATANDLVTVSGTADVTGATLAPNFVGDGFAPGQQFLLIDSVNPITGAFANAGDTFSLPLSDFLDAVQDTSLGADDFGLILQDNGTAFATSVTGCNDLRAAALFETLRTTDPASDAVLGLLNGTTAEAASAIAQVSGSIYPSLISAEIFHIQNNIESARDRISQQRFGDRCNCGLMSWIRPYGVSGSVDADDCETAGYRHEVGGLELGAGYDRGNGITGYVFGTLATGNVSLRSVNQDADVDSYRIGGILQYQRGMTYAIVSGGAGTQDYDVTRSLDLIGGSTLAQSSFSGESAFGYAEFGFNAYPNWTPYIALHGTTVDLDGATETGDATFALTVPQTSGESLRSVLGVSLVGQSHIATTRLRFGWLHEYFDESENVLTETAGAGQLFTNGVKPGIDWGFVRTQVDMGTFLGGNLSVAYQGQFNSRSTYNLLAGGVHWIF